MAWDGKVYAYQFGRNPLLPSRLRPGVVILAHAIRAAIEAGRREFDFLADECLYKTQLALATRRLVRLRAARPCLREWTRRAAEKGIKGLRLLRRAGRAALRSFRSAAGSPKPRGTPDGADEPGFIDQPTFLT
jgi:hypothetical protein